MKSYEEEKSEFINNRFLTCSCGYNNRRDRLENFGTCLRCGKIIDKRSYFKKRIGDELYGKKKRNKRKCTK